MTATGDTTGVAPAQGGPPRGEPDAPGHPGLLERPISRHRPDDPSARRLRGRPELYTSYAQDMALLNTPGKRWGVGVGLVVTVAAVLVLPANLLTLAATTFATAIGAIGLNLVTGYAGQVSLGHAFFIGLGAITAAVVGDSGEAAQGVVGLGLSFLPVWLLAAGLVAAVAGGLVAPLALRLKGLYLAIVTLGLVFLGGHLFRVGDQFSGGIGVGRAAAPATLGPFSFNESGELLGVMVTSEQRLYLLMLAMLVLFAVVGRNIARSDLGRAFAAVRDRDIAAEIIGVDLTRAKVLAFVISSFYAGCAGALLYTVIGVIEPGSFGLLMSIEYIAMILIGGVATISGSIMGAVFFGGLARASRELIDLLPAALGFSEAVLESVLAGTLLIGFLLFEPRGLYGIWARVRAYWKGWPFSY